MILTTALITRNLKAETQGVCGKLFAGGHGDGKGVGAPML